MFPELLCQSPGLNWKLFLMATTLPGPTVAVIRFAFYLVAAIGADENPDFTFCQLHSVKRGFFFLTYRADFGFHLLSGIELAKPGSTHKVQSQNRISITHPNLSKSLNFHTYRRVSKETKLVELLVKGN